MGFRLTLASPGHFFTFGVFNMEFGYIRRDCDTAKVRRSEKVCTSRVSNLGSFQDPISSSLEENPQNTPRCPENVKNTAKHPAWMDIIDIMHFTFSSSNLNTHQMVKKARFGLNYPQTLLKRSWAR